MIDQKSMNVAIASGLKKATGCEVVKSNLTGNHIPPYPYISFTILNTETRKGTYSGSGGRYIPAKQTWSFTVQGNDDDEAFLTAMKAHDWLEETGRVYLNDHGIVAQSTGQIQNRDTLLTVEYEYRKGFDVIFSVMNRVEGPEIETIGQAEIKQK